ncbi:MAG: twitching motility protein PilT [Myxococcota bacterium]|jgi:twitching motility protein PilT
MSVTIDQILRFAVQQGVSDIHLKVGRPPIYRKDGRLVPHKGAMVLQPIHIKEWVEHMAGERQRGVLNEMGEVDFAYSLHGVARFRVNAFYQRELAGLVARIIPTKIMSMEELNLPKALNKLTALHRGLVLVTGATGSGKSTTLASLINEMNVNRAAHILTVEDPIEFVHEDKKAVVNQREIGQDTGSFLSALRAALRQDPDVILIGEMRDTETIETALHAAETGHLVLSTLHTLDATETISRIIGMFADHQQHHIRKVLGQVLQAVISQRLVPTVGGKGRVAACEVMMVTELVRECIWDAERTHEVREYMSKAGKTHGSQTFDMALVAHFRSGMIDEKTVYEYASNPGDVKLLLSGIS